jgi:hypothetical protein
VTVRQAPAQTGRDSARLRRFVLTAVAFAVVFAALGQVYGEDIALELQKTPTTTPGWRLAGWLLSGPPLLVALGLWHERGRLAPGLWRRYSTLVAAWVGANMLVLPALTRGVDGQFGTGALVGDPLTAGWVWGAVAALVGAVFSGVVLVVLHRTVADPSAEQRDLTARFLERAWVVILVASVGFALYWGR